MSSKKTFLFLYGNLLIGGIEKWIFNEILALSKEGHRIIWMQYGGKIHEGWKDTISQNVEVVKTNISKKNWFKYEPFTLEKDEEVVAVCFGFIDLARLLCLKRDYPDNNISCFNIIPHFTMAHYYPEDNFSFLLKGIIKKKIKYMYEQYDKNNNILFFSKRHVATLENKYSLTVENPSDKLLKSVEPMPEFDEALLKERSKRQDFKIITCGRMEFPHKGYMVGLVKAYAQLKEKYPNLKLDIIGYGEDEDKLKNLINEYSDEIKRDICLLGAVSPSDTPKYFDKAHVNISVAGGVSMGAKTGLVSIPARHYDYSCEVYGYLPQSKTYNLSSEPGEDVKKYITELIEMPSERYEQLCRDSYGAYSVPKESIDPFWILSLKNNSTLAFEDKFIRFSKKLDKYIKCKALLFAIPKKIKKLFFRG